MARARSQAKSTAQFTAESEASGEFVRQPNRFTARVTADGSSGWPADPGRYRLVWCRACPWSHRARIVLGLLGLEDAISVGTVDPIRDERGWRFGLDPGGHDPVLGIEYLSDAYLATDPAYTGRVTVPALVDVPSGTVVSNDYPQITLDLSTQWHLHHRPGAPDLYPEDLREEIDAVNDLV
ncbi:MAG: glutathione S-transferase family protein, partial [Actinomycetota bacterium]|nr:glutathione S-transferase family protein [Actinomycetota bacterium]